MTYWRRFVLFFDTWYTILLFWRKPPPKPRPKISLLIPFSSSDPQRRTTFKWLLKYWRHELPDAEIVIGRSRGKVFCKGEALNRAANKATGRVLVVLDADAYMPGEMLDRAADRILDNLDNHLWLVPYRRLYRLRKAISEQVIASDPRNPLRLPSPPPIEDVEGDGKQSRYGARYGAMCMMFPREAMEVIGCFDERFRGWGGEDVALLRALDTLYGKHKTMNNDILHLWHPTYGDSFQTRMWKGQKGSQPNGNLANAYNRATRNPTQMQALVDAGCRASKKYKNLNK